MLRMYDRFFSMFCWLGSVLLFGLRYHWGWAFVNAGGPKLTDPEGPTQFFTGLGIPFPDFNVWLVGNVEYWGGFLLIWGLATRFAGLALAITMITAYMTAHFDAVKATFPAWDPRMWDMAPFAAESPFMFLLVSLLVVAFGPGMISIDGVIRGVANKLSGKSCCGKSCSKSESED